MAAQRLEAAKRIGAAKRSKDARTEVAARRRERDARNAAARTLQTRQRRKLQLREELEHAVITVQSRWRATAATAQVAARRVAANSAATSLQFCQRRKMRRRAEQKRLSDQEARRGAAAATVQARYRGGVSRSLADRRRRKRDESLAAAKLAAAQTKAATLIQAVQRGKSARVAFQSVWRAGQQASGLKWERARAKPAAGTDLSANGTLRDALRRTHELTRETLTRCKIPKGVRGDSYILVDKVYLQPVLGQRKAAA